METKIINYSEKAIAVVGDTKKIKDELKKLGGRFNPRLSCGAGWIFSAKKREQVQALLDGFEVVGNNNDKPKKLPNVKKDEKALIEEYLFEYGKRWDEPMVAYTRKKISSVIRLENGGLLAFEKPQITTSFCFGYDNYSGTTSDDAHKMAEHARTSEKYFLEQNLGDIDAKIKALRDNCSDYRYGDGWYIHPLSGHSNWNLWDYNAAHKNDMVYHPSFYIGYQEMSEIDRKAILNQLKVERKKFEKRLQTYLKKYGLSKIKSWSYWAD